MLYSDYIPRNSAITWDDVYRFTGSNNIGRNSANHIIGDEWNAGMALAKLADYLGDGNFIPANEFTACFEYGLTYNQYHAIAETIAKSIYAQRNLPDEEPYEYWLFIVNNCYGVFKECVKNGHDLS